MFSVPKCAKHEQIREDGTVDEKHATPWLMQCMRDIAALRFLEEGMELLEELKGRPLRLFREQREQFTAIQLGGLRAVYWAGGFEDQDAEEKGEGEGEQQASEE
eukprot:11216134-Lingulodinium_polyedra.AAC.1